jgi:hypothetical protein
MFKVNGRQVGSGVVQHKNKVDVTHVLPRWVTFPQAGN